MTGAFMASIVIKATVILALGLGALRVLRQSRAAVRHLLLLAVCATVLALPLAAFVLPVLAIPLPYRVTATVPSAVSGIQPDVAFTTAPAAGAVTPSPNGPSDAVSVSWLMLIVEGLGATLALLPLLAGLWQTRRLRASARPWPRGQERIERLVRDAQIRRHVDVLVHDGLPGPVTCGVWRPVLLFPADATQWDDADFEGAAIHELEHVRRHDWATDCFARVVCAAYWFHPLVWTTWRQLRLESERAADDAVVCAREGTAYADLLVTLAERRATDQRKYVMAMASRRDLPLRIQALLDASLPRGRAGRRCIVITALLATGVVLAVAPLGALTPQTQTSGVVSGVEPVGAMNLRLPEEWSGAPSAAPEVSLAARAEPALPLAAQSDARRFEVATIKPSAPDAWGMMISGPAPDQFRTVNAPLERIILYAFGRHDYQLVGAPDWIRSEHFDITTKYPADHSPAQVPAMVRALLEDRFKLKTHADTREGPVYALVLARPDGKPGPDLRRPDVDCEAELAKGTGTRTIMPGTPCFALQYGEGRDRLIWGGNRTMAQLAVMLSAAAGRDVLDRTGLTGTFDARLRWRPDAGLTTAPDAQLTPDAGVSLFTAVQEQLGLKLESTRAPLEVLVIDSVERPTPD